MTNDSEEKRSGPGATEPLPEQKPRRAINEEFAMRILPRFLPYVHGSIVHGERFTSIPYVYLHVDGEQLTHEAQDVKVPSYLLGSGSNRLRHALAAFLTHGFLTHESGDGDRE
jgi:hypothetical protein